MTGSDMVTTSMGCGECIAETGWPGAGAAAGVTWMCDCGTTFSVTGLGCPAPKTACVPLADPGGAIGA
jgi:hypothetical protein